MLMTIGTISVAICHCCSCDQDDGDDLDDYKQEDDEVEGNEEKDAKGLRRLRDRLKMAGNLKVEDALAIEPKDLMQIAWQVKSKKRRRRVPCEGHLPLPCRNERRTPFDFRLHP